MHRKQLYMNTIEYKNNKYKVREIELPEVGNVLISTIYLNQSLLNLNNDYASEEAISIDESIYYFVDEKEIEFSDEELRKILITEIK